MILGGLEVVAAPVLAYMSYKVIKKVLTVLALVLVVYLLYVGFFGNMYDKMTMKKDTEEHFRDYHKDFIPDELKLSVMADSDDEVDIVYTDNMDDPSRKTSDLVVLCDQNRGMCINHSGEKF